VGQGSSQSPMFHASQEAHFRIFPHRATFLCPAVRTMGNSGTHSELEIISKLRRGDEEAFSLLFRRHYEPLCFFAGRFTKDLNTAESLVQEAFVKLWESREALQIRASLKSYLYTSVKNACLNLIKHESFSYPLESVERKSDDPITRPDVQLESDEMTEAVERAINELPPKQREILCLAKYDELSYQEIAEIQHVRINTVKTQLKRALKSLSKSLQHMHIALLLLKF
jgi:RNA polymerase sigma-70 factor (ECF subfamily)